MAESHPPLPEAPARRLPGKAPTEASYGESHRYGEGMEASSLAMDTTGPLANDDETVRQIGTEITKRSARIKKIQDRPITLRSPRGRR